MDRLKASLLLLVSLATSAGAQQDRSIVVVTDSLRRPIPFAFVQLVRGVARVADDSGRAFLGAVPDDSLRLSVRRMGFEPFIGWVRRSGPSEYHVTLGAVARALAEVTVEARQNTVLAKTGFYDRLERTQRGAASARFWTPEELDMRNPAKLSQVLAGESMVQMKFYRGRPILIGRGQDCGFTILLDGRLIPATLESAHDLTGRRDIERAMIRGGGDPGEQERQVGALMSTLISVDELITGASVAAIEVYGSISAAPVELQRLAGRSRCGIIAIWSGARK
jgi:hypothetical protein